MHCFRLDSRHFLVGLLSLLLAAGCARAPLGPALEGEARSAGERRYADYLAADSNCSPGFDGEAVVHWHSALEAFSFSGYFQAMPPSFFRFTATNPLGQPLFAMATNGRSFQAIDTDRRRYLAGSLRSWGVRHRISQAFITGPWSSWLAGRPPPEASELISVYQDDQDRGIWYGVGAPNTRNIREYLLVGREQYRLRSRIILDRNGNMQAELHYGGWERVGGCQQPMTLEISGLSFGAEAALELSEVRPAKLAAEDFSLPPPSNYPRTLLP